MQSVAEDLLGATEGSRTPPSPPSRPPSPPYDPFNMADDEDHKSSSMVAKPSDFDGTKWDIFSAQILLYLFANKKKIKTDTEKITTILSFMKSGSAATWARYKAEQMFIDSTNGMPLDTPRAGIFSDFWKECLAMFQNPDQKAEASRDVTELKQGHKTCAEYFQLLDQALVRAGYVGSGLDTWIIEQVRVSIDPSIAMDVARVTPPITTYEAYKDMARRIDQQVRAQKAAKHEDRRGTSSSKPVFIHKGRDHHIKTKRDPTGVTHGGMGEPMQLDEAKRRNLCYNCGKPGHMVKDCPTGRQKAKQYVRSLQPAQRNILASELSQLKESDFVDEFEVDPHVSPIPLDDEQSFSDSEQ